MSALFDLGRQKFLEGSIAYLSDTIKVMLVDEAIDTQNTATDEFFDDLQMEGTGDSIANIDASTGELTDAAASFTSAMIGRWITIAGATSGGNNGTFLITAVPAGTQIRYANSNPSVTEAFPGTWDISARVGNSGQGERTDMPTLAGKTSTNGVADANDSTFTTVTASAALASLVVFKDSGVDGTSPLIAYINSGTGLPVTPNGGDINVAWDSGANKIFKL